MDFLLTEEQLMIRDMVSTFAKNEIGPVAAENQKKGIYPKEIIAKASELGLLGIAYPVEFNGAGVDYVSYM